jgi:hypothetical protein
VRELGQVGRAWGGERKGKKRATRGGERGGPREGDRAAGKTGLLGWPAFLFPFLFFFSNQLKSI